MPEKKKRKKQTGKYITKKMAQETALNIQAYWLNKGYLIQIWVEKITIGNARDYAVRSNMQNGKPY